ncbi:ParM/StbA family protein [uncultured Vibrio sp.]|uniref:ParM/StbA family protein n=1 Tax=uncultured Vibrio sp. TaxID=114054 RepID=UPI00260CB1E7|nr:ParM/StbA family protein [uncultured Vibrio sp.]
MVDGMDCLGVSLIAFECECDIVVTLKDCLTLGGKMKISIDDGSNFTKWAFSDDNGVQKGAFPSRVIRSALPSSSGDGFSNSSYEIDGQRYAVALSANDVIPTTNKQFQVSDANRVLIQHALRQAPPQKSAEIVLTLPVGQFFNQDGSKNEALIKQKIENAKGSILCLDGKTAVEVEACYVLPEGLAAFNHVKNELNLREGEYLIADIGGTTTDLIVFDESNQIQSFKSVNVGAIQMLDSFGALVMGELSINQLSDKHKLNGLLSGTIAGEDVSKHATQALKSFTDKVFDQVHLMGDLNLFNGVVFSGGGANLLNSDFVKILKTANPQLDNALGALDIIGG